MFKTIIVIAPNGYSAVTTAMSRNPENVLRMLVEDIAHPPARSGAGSEDVRDAERWRMASTSDDFGIATRGPHGVTVRYDSGAREMIDAAISASKPNAASAQPDRSEES